MAQHRFSIPFVGGYTIVFTQEEMEQKKAETKEAIRTKSKKIWTATKKFTSKTMTSTSKRLATVAERIDKTVTE